MSFQTINSDKSIESQIVFMLNDVMIEEDSGNQKENKIPFHEAIFLKSDSESIGDEKDTNCSSRLTSSKESNNKQFLRKSVTFPSKSKEYNIISPTEFTRRIPNKNFKTQTINPQVSNKLMSVDCIQQNPNILNNSLFKNSNAHLNHQQIIPNLNNSVNNNNYFTYSHQINPINHLDNIFQENNINKSNQSYLYYENQLRAQQYNMLFNSQLFVKPTFSPEEQIFLNFENDLINETKFTYEIFQKYKNDFIKLIKNQQISRLSQLYIHNSSPEILHLFYSEISSQIPQLLIDIYANYFILKLFFFLDNNDSSNFLNQISKSFTSLCLNKISTYPIQYIVKRIKNKHSQELIIDSIKKHLMKITLDVYGTHVIEKILSNFEYDLIQPISKFVADNFLFLSNNANGLCVVKKIIIVEYKKNYFHKIKELSEENALVLIQNPFGNYTLQCIIDNWQLEDIEKLIQMFIGKCSVLSVQKFSSNVIEKCIEKSQYFLKEFLNECNANNFCGTGVLMQSNYGNYVIQTALKVISGKDRDDFIVGIYKNFSKITDKKLISKWKNILINIPIYNNHEC
jgi:hypothetical protein